MTANYASSFISKSPAHSLPYTSKPHKHSIHNLLYMHTYEIKRLQADKTDILYLSFWIKTAYESWIESNFPTSSLTYYINETVKQEFKDCVSYQILQEITK